MPSPESQSPSELPPTTRPTVHGLSLTPLTQCLHWSSPLDIIAIKHACCNKFYACISCHNAQESHEPAIWPRSKRDERVVLCGACGRLETIEGYMNGGSVCRGCGRGFNPGCKRHWGYYFEVEREEKGN